MGLEISEIYKFNLQNCEEVPYCKIENFSCGDLVVHPNGNFFVIGSNILIILIGD
ncbi:MAG: hypothetical protein IPO48_07795 [Saprospiraceae bacterium]|nr:hypothetical protein [Saprospiraceae bacterium]